MEAEHGAAAGPLLTNPAAGPERAAEQASVAALVSRMPAEELTERQRRAMMQGMPLEKIARRMGTERNALDKLLHDARLRPKARLERAGPPAGEVVALMPLFQRHLDMCADCRAEFEGLLRILRAQQA